ncbi:unnamed protein product, partial [Pleuronectes platessa]
SCASKWRCLEGDIDVSSLTPQSHQFLPRRVSFFLDLAFSAPRVLATRGDLVLQRPRGHYRSAAPSRFAPGLDPMYTRGLEKGGPDVRMRNLTTDCCESQQTWTQLTVITYLGYHLCDRE